MGAKRSYIAAAFNARPLGMPVPPNWFALAAFALLGFFLHPGLWLIGAGLEGLYLWTLSRHPRFRAAVDATDGAGRDDGRYNALMAMLDAEAHRQQTAIERQAGEIVALFTRSGPAAVQIGDLHRMAWLHLKLLAARSALLKVNATAREESGPLADQLAHIEQRLAGDALDDELRQSLERQREVIAARRKAHADAARRRELIDAEIERLRQQVALVREQALLSTDEQSAARSLNAVSASLNEANRWLKEQRELFAGLEDLTDDPPQQILAARSRFGRRGRMAH